MLSISKREKNSNQQKKPNIQKKPKTQTKEQQQKPQNLQTNPPKIYTSAEQVKKQKTSDKDS